MQPNSPELIALYQDCDVFVLPTRAEAFGIAAVEACAAGLPVIATRSAGLIDIVIDGETGYFIPTDDEAALVQLLRGLALDQGLRLRMARRARAHAEARFDVRKNVGRLVDILIEAAGCYQLERSEGSNPP